METKHLINTITSLKAGTFHTITYSKEIKPAAAFKDNVITKTTRMSFRTGCRYAHLHTVIERRNINPDSSQTYSPWWDWVPGMERRIKVHKKDSTKLYLNICPTPNAKVKTEYKINGARVTKQEVMAITPPSMWKNAEFDTLDIAFENIINIK